MAAQNSASRPNPSPFTDISDAIVRLPNNINIRTYRNSDAQSISHHGNSKAVWNNLRNRMPHPYTLKDATDWFEINQKPESQVRSGPWTLETGSQGPLVPANYTIAVGDEAIGSIGLVFGDPTDVYARSAELGYWIGEEYWGKGVMSVAVPAFVEWVWATFGILVRLNATVVSVNAGSRRVLEKAGFQYEGIKKFALLKNGVVLDEIVLGAIRPGYQ